MRVTVDDVNFCDSLECVYVKYNTWVFAGQNMAVDSVPHGF